MTAAAGPVDRARAGDREAFGELYATYQPQVYALVLHRTGDRHLAEDLSSETFARALADHYKCARTNRETPVGDIHDLDRAAGDPPDQVVDDLARCEQAHAVRQALATLSWSQQEILRLRFWGELPFADIARTTGRTVSSAKMRKTRALDKLRRQLATIPQAG